MLHTAMRSTVPDSQARTASISAHLQTATTLPSRRVLNPTCCVKGRGARAGASCCSTAWDLLQDYTRKDFQGLAQSMRETKAQRDKLRKALQTVLAQKNAELGWDPDKPEILLGILSSDVRLGVRALRDWSNATGAQFLMPDSQVAGIAVPNITGPVFIKLNSVTKSCYVSLYQGQDRGALLNLGQVQLGHFPLGLWDEQKSTPAPHM